MTSAKPVQIDRDKVGADTPLRLETAAALYFPDGGVTAANLRQEGKRGRLAISRIGGKDFTTLAAVEEMYRACQLQKASASGSDQPARDTPQSELSTTEICRRARDAVLAKLNAPDRHSKPKSLRKT